jgi:hypothetical protein
MAFKAREYGARQVKLKMPPAALKFIQKGIDLYPEDQGFSYKKSQ